MLSSNMDYIAKADMAVSDLTSGGLLVAEQVTEFFEILIEESVLLQMCTTVPMSGPTWELPKMGFTGEVLRRATESEGLGKDDRVKPVMDKVSLATKELIAEARIPYGVVEDNVANGSFPQVAMGMLGKAVARDLEKLVIRGDTTSTGLLSTFDGVLKRATTYVVNAGGVRLSKSVFKPMLQTLPSQFFAPSMAFLSSKNAVIDYSDSLANRQTPKGDDFLVKRASAEYMGYPVIQIPLFPENLGGTTDRTNALFLDPKNIHVGMQREVRIETARDISARMFIIVATLKVDQNYAHEPAVVKATEILASAG